MAKKIFIKIPQYFSHKHFDDFLKEIRGINASLQGGGTDVIFDLSDNEFSSTLGILLLAKTSDQFFKDGYQCFVIFPSDEEKKDKQKRYLQTMEWIQPIENKQFSKHLNTFRVPIQRCYSEKECYEAINEKIIPLLRNEFHPTETVLKAVNWALWETIGNSIVHGYSLYDYDGQFPHPVYCCAFSYKEFIDIAILDVGQGIHNSFLSSGKEKYKDITNEKSLRLSIENGVSGSSTGSPGFGLYGCSEIVKNSNGELIIISGENKLVSSEKNISIELSQQYQGVMVKLRIPVKIDLDLTKIFNKDNLIVTEDIDFLTGDFDE